jgi:hypothetical protein
VLRSFRLETALLYTARSDSDWLQHASAGKKFSDAMRVSNAVDGTARKTAAVPYCRLAMYRNFVRVVCFITLVPGWFYKRSKPAGTLVLNLVYAASGNFADLRRSARR